ncbi:MAG TPA: GIY-YIG nuclease family protein [Patescibacteria group bacterium]|nr:GIY-YIG nuclease family protein [Patescibacteria group bacterium]
MFYSYLLKLSNDDFYAGSTTNMKSRIKKHQSGGVPHTSKFRPVKLVWYAAFANRELAASFEKYLKSSSGKAFRNKHLLNKKL